MTQTGPEGARTRPGTWEMSLGSARRRSFLRPLEGGHTSTNDWVLGRDLGFSESLIVGVLRVMLQVTGPGTPKFGSGVKLLVGWCSLQTVKGRNLSMSGRKTVVDRKSSALILGRRGFRASESARILQPLPPPLHPPTSPFTPSYVRPSCSPPQMDPGPRARSKMDPVTAVCAESKTPGRGFRTRRFSAYGPKPGNLSRKVWFTFKCSKNTHLPQYGSPSVRSRSPTVWITAPG